MINNDCFCPLVVRLSFLGAALLVAQTSWALRCPHHFSQVGEKGNISCVRIHSLGTSGQGDSRTEFSLNQSNLDFYYNEVVPCEKANGWDGCGMLWDLNGGLSEEKYSSGRSHDEKCLPSEPNCSQSGSGKSGALATAGQGGLPQAEEMEGDRNACKSQENKASVCCNDPIQCVSGLKGPDRESVADLSSLAAGTLGALSMSVGPEGISKNCQLMKMVGLGGATANAALGAKCFIEKKSCESKCQRVEDKYRQVVTECENLEIAWQANGGRGPRRCSKGQLNDYRTILAASIDRKNRCSVYGANAAKMVHQATHSGIASKYAQLCESASKAQNTGFPSIGQHPMFSGDCSDPANASNPICVKCRGDAAKYDPICKGLGGGGYQGGSGGGGGSGFSDADFGALSSNGGDDVWAEGTQSQASVLGGGASDPVHANAIPQNGGGFAGGSGGGMPFGGGGQGQGGGQGAGYDTDIMKGVGGGGGYSSVSGVGVAARSGYRGSFGGGSGGGGLKDSPNRFDLKKYLPGGEKDPKRRGLAGLQTRKSEIGKPHEDIFQRVSNRVKILCKMRRLYDCR